MDFEKLYQKYKNGTATEEEIKIVEDEIRKAKEINTILEETPNEVPKIENVEAIEPDSPSFSRDKFNEALKYFNIKQFIKTLIITVTVIVLVSIIAVGTVFGIAIYSAHQGDNVTEDQAVENAKTYIAEYANVSVEDIRISERIDKDLEMKLNLTKSLYVYEIELLTPSGEYTVEVNTTSGYVHITDVDSDDRYSNRHDGRKDRDRDDWDDDFDDRWDD